MTAKILLIEPFYSGSHKVLMDLLHDELKSTADVEVQLFTLPGKKWHWRARTSALYFSQNIPKERFSTIFVSCVLPLHELLGLRPDLFKAKKILYFHENQLVYPVRKSLERDFQYGYNQILSCLAANSILFNSEFNMQSFLTSIKPFFKLQPDFRPKDLQEKIEIKCRVLFFPMKLPLIRNSLEPVKTNEDTVRIIWPHRWEFDKNPDMFFRVLFRLHDESVPFRLSVLGENFTDNPLIFTEAKTKLEIHIDHFGYLPSKDEYFDVLKTCDIVVSTADHEFFGVAMLECVSRGCFPLCPNKLVYPEFYPAICLYKSELELFGKLKSFLTFREAFVEARTTFNDNFDYTKFQWENLRKDYLSCVLEETINV